MFAIEIQDDQKTLAEVAGIEIASPAGLPDFGNIDLSQVRLYLS